MTTFLGAIGVPHYTKDGKLYTGEMHKDASGRLMTGKFHTANSRFLFHTKNGVGGIKGTKAENIFSAANKRKIISDYREFISNGFPKSEAKKFALRNYTYLTYGLDKAEAELEKLIKKNKDLIESSRSYVPDSQFKV